MLRLAIDENFNNDVLRGLLRRSRNLDVVRVQDAGLGGADDPVILDWAAAEKRVLVSHDISTLIAHAYLRVSREQPMPGVLEVPRGVSIRQAIEELQLLAECAEPSEVQNHVLFLPL